LHIVTLRAVYLQLQYKRENLIIRSQMTVTDVNACRKQQSFVTAVQDVMKLKSLMYLSQSFYYTVFRV